ncbi:MCE family protein [Mycobacterium sp. OTB74]|uniref:MCE family protein n=1 Tax=Mycobacterium sp. OTB74 TaxID=1853452 RepID=UPI002476415C|nr:MCE family protein [Mycobacterium sp. OTB74]
MTGCTFQGINSLPLPGAVGRGPHSVTYRAEIANIGTLEENSPVMLDDVVVGSVGAMRFDNWHIAVTFSVRPDVSIPANAVVTVGQTSLLGSMHLAVDPPPGVAPTGKLPPGATVPLAATSTYPSTEQTLLALSAVVNGGNLGQVGDVIHSLNKMFTGHQQQIRDLITRLNDFVGRLDSDRDSVLATVRSLDRLAGTLAAQNDVISTALKEIPPALDVLIRQRSTLTTALDKLRTFSETSNQVITNTRDDLIANLVNLAPTFKALADVGPYLDIGLAAATTFPQAQDTIDRGVKGDYMNLFGVVDLTIPRLKRTMMLGTRWGDDSAQLVPAPGEPYGRPYTNDPLHVPTTPVAPKSSTEQQVPVGSAPESGQSAPETTPNQSAGATPQDRP